MIRLWLMAACVGAALVAAPLAVRAEEVQRIVAVVNNDIVSQHDLQNRINLFVATANVPDTPDVREGLKAEMLQTLINDRLKAQEARKRNITVSQAELDDALTQIAQQLRLSPAELRPYLEKRGAKLATLIEQVETEIAWTKAVQRAAAGQVTVGDDEVDEEVARLIDTPIGPEYRVAEIFLPVDSRAAEPSVLALAQRLINELRRGAAFPTLARTFSQGPTAASGGDLGWVRRGQLHPELDRYLDELDRGELIGPLKTPDGYRLLLMIDKREPIAGKAGRTLLTLLQVFAPLPPEADGAQRAAMVDGLRRLGAGAGSCEEVERRNQQLPAPLPTNTSQLPLRELPGELRPLVVPMQPGDAAGPVQVSNGLLLLVMCARAEEGVSPELRELARERLEQERITEVARRLLRELRRNAVVDVRT